MRRIPPERAPLGDLFLEELRVADEDSQDVVEVVGDSPGQRPERLHLLRPTQSLFEPLAFLLQLLAGRDVDDGAPDAGKFIFMHDP